MNIVKNIFCICVYKGFIFDVTDYVVSKLNWYLEDVIRLKVRKYIFWKRDFFYFLVEGLV